eukprot:TRINITY_DN4335_c0_g1_i8.p1 TRINITY_DN4335_c0_g1~~TRINITY_DN4335_c0_g1_i8.p1  ORF type:complete len:130 (-),score=13.35 TRINITY_DN4335_c0_g1_i8:20-409(-)
MLFPDTFSIMQWRYFDYNFGTIEVEFDSERRNVRLLRLQVRDVNGKIALEKVIDEKGLQRKMQNIDTKQCKSYRIFPGWQRWLYKIWKDLGVVNVLLGTFAILGIPTIIIMTLKGIKDWLLYFLEIQKP